jgi:hypothetical protein
LDSPNGTFKAISEDNLDASPKSNGSPKRERFRDKMMSKFKKKTSRTHSETSDNVSIRSMEDESEKFLVFGNSLEKVEKDTFHKNVPKIMVDCVNLLELDVNLKTHGIYRISGNKTTMDAIKKKLNEKKQPRKESKYACLQDQDVHTLTGLLKMFFRELQPPLMSAQIFSQCTAGKNCDK